MPFIERILHRPSYGWTNETGTLIQPSGKQLFKETLSRLNIFRSRKNWISLLTLVMMLSMIPFLYFFIVHHFSWLLLGAVLVYAMIIMGTHGHGALARLVMGSVTARVLAECTVPVLLIR